MQTTAELRRAAVDRTFFPQSDLASAIARLGFVQADPIRAPARAQDLILRHRVVGYSAGDLEAAYPALPVFEDMLHVYGFVHRMHRNLLHPRRIARHWQVEDEHPHLRRAILDHLQTHGASHPRAIDHALVEHYPRASIVNAWGGTSNATTRMLEVLHYRGLLHVTRRERGIRIYEMVSPRVSPRVSPQVSPRALRTVNASKDQEPQAERPRTLSPQRRADGMILLLAALYAPLPKASLIQLVGMLGDRALPRVQLHDRVASLLRRCALQSSVVDGVAYVWPAHGDGKARHDERVREPIVGELIVPESVVGEPSVRFLAPFDPLVWDRRRFKHLWDWDYRFEAYTPAAKRRLGYYAMPMLWDAEGDAQVIGWVNVTTLVTTRGAARRKRIMVEAGYIAKRPRGASFKREFEAEVERLERFLIGPD